MKRLIIVSLFLGILGGCGYMDRKCVGFTGKPVTTCYDGITYLQFTSGATVQFDINGKPVPCNQ